MSARCGREECVFKAIKDMIQKMKEDIAKTQNIAYPEQIVVADIYKITASSLAEACRKCFRINLENCEEEEHREPNITIDTFILLKTLEEENLISSEYKEKIFETLLKMKPELKERVEKDRESGLI